MRVASELRWIVRHGLTRIALRRAARRGDLAARIVYERATRADPFPVYELIRARGPLVPGVVGFSTVSHQVASTALRGEAFGVSRNFSALPRPMRALIAYTQGRPVATPVDPPSMLVTDPPDHTRYRKLVTKVFTPRAIEALRGRTEQVAHELLDRMAAGGNGRPDLVETYASLLPVTVISEILGVPGGMRDQFLTWGNGAAVSLDLGIGHAASVRADRAILALSAWMRGHFDDLRRSPGDDILSRLVTLVDQGERLTEDELAGIAMLVLGAGFETTVNLIGNGVATLLRHPAQLSRLIDEPAGWANAVEEILRYESPVQATIRFTRTAVTLGGVDLPPGAALVLLVGGANRDPAVFDDPGRFDVDRPNAREHLAFSAGAHFCLGASLARMEGEIALRALFSRFPDLALAGEPRRRPTRTLRGYETLPVALTAGRRLTTPAVGP